MPRTIVIGTGISAVAYMAAVQRERDETVQVMGGPDLWRRMPGGHAMGQPAQLLTGNLLGGATRGFTAPPIPGTTPFLDAGQFARLLDDQMARSGAAHLPDSMVETIRRRSGGGYEIDVRVGGEQVTHGCDRVVLAMGPGPLRPLTQGPAVDAPEVGSFGGRVVDGNSFMLDSWKRPEGLPEHAKVAVYGGSATAAWVVERAQARRLEVVRWFTRPGGTEFNGAFPPGERNTEVKERTELLRRLATLERVEIAPGEAPDRPLLLSLTEGGATTVFPAQLLVFALGSAHGNVPGGIPRIVHASIHPDLEAYWDYNRTISDDASLLAIGTRDRTLMIVGAAMCSKAGLGNLDKMKVKIVQLDKTLKPLGNYTDISRSLPPAARPPEGIAMVMAGIEALSGFMPVTPATRRRPDRSITGRDINFNTSNRTQLAVWVAQVTDIDPFSANLAVALIVKLRGGMTLGLSDAEVEIILDRAQEWVRFYRGFNPEMDKNRLIIDKGYKDDTYLNMHCTLLTTDPWMLEVWRRRGIVYRPDLHEPPPEPRR